MKGTIFDIKEFSIHDGPGARTTVFLKGCPLRCLWCHNPEGLKTTPQLLYKKALCSHCNRCKEPCTHPECIPFDRCIHACPNGCLSVAGREIESADLAEQLRKNTDFFHQMDGGITFSGGEPLLQSDFLLEMRDHLSDLHLAIQTSGYADPQIYRSVVDRFDFVMQDLKLSDSSEHLRYTGVGNEVILENIAYLKKSGTPYLLRVPMIPDIVDTEENLKGIQQIADGSPIEYLKYNPMAGAKYEMLDMAYPLNSQNPR